MSANSVNKVILMGHLGADPELRYTSKGTPVCNLSVATNYRRKESDGNYTEHRHWHRIVAWGRQGELCKEYLGKGRQVFVEGRLQNSSYKDGEGVKRYTTEIVSSNVLFLGGGRGSGVSTGASSSSAEGSIPDASAAGSEEDLPF